MPLYSLVDYGETGTDSIVTDLVPTSWLMFEEEQQYCWWPPKSVAVANAVKKRTTPKPATWKQCLVIKVVKQFGE
jgi:hypothetical protein